MLAAQAWTGEEEKGAGVSEPPAAQKTVPTPDHLSGHHGAILRLWSPGLTAGSRGSSVRGIVCSGANGLL